MEQSELLRYLTETLERLGIRYMVTGSVATIFYGEPRFTNDIDVVVVLPPARCAEFCLAFALPDFYVSEEAALRAVADGGQFNILHPSSGLKVDVIVAGQSPFDRSRLARIVRVAPDRGHAAWFASPEDVIIKKLAYYHEGGSDKHLRDIAGVLKVSGDRLDRAYIADWTERLGLREIWISVCERLNQPWK